MTRTAKMLLKELDSLPEQERSEVVAELLRRTALAPHDVPDNADLVNAADGLFVELDPREQS